MADKISETNPKIEGFFELLNSFEVLNQPPQTTINHPKSVWFLSEKKHIPAGPWRRRASQLRRRASAWAPADDERP